MCDCTKCAGVFLLERLLFATLCSDSSSQPSGSSKGGRKANFYLKEKEISLTENLRKPNLVFRCPSLSSFPPHTFIHWTSLLHPCSVSKIFCCRTFCLIPDCPSSWVNLLSLPLKCLCCVYCTFSCPTDFFGWKAEAPRGICDLRHWKDTLCLMPQKGDGERHELLL